MSELLQRLEAARNAATRELDAACLSKWPANSRARVYLSARQRTPTEAEILSSSGGVLFVRLCRLSRRGYWTTAHVHWSKVEGGAS